MRPIKTLLAIAMFGFGTTFSVSAQNNKSNVAFDTYEWDFGTISTQKGAVCHTFTFKNQSKKDIKIGKQISSCECVQAHYSDKAIKPGESGQVMLAFKPDKISEKAFRSIELLDTEGNTLGALSIKAVVVEEDNRNGYPYQDTNLSNEERVENLISLLTPE